MEGRVLDRILIIPLVRPHIAQTVDVQPVVPSAGLHRGRMTGGHGVILRGILPHRLERGLVKTQFVYMVGRLPLPDDPAGSIHFIEDIAYQLNPFIDVVVTLIDMRQNKGDSALAVGLPRHGIHRRALALKIMVLAGDPCLSLFGGLAGNGGHLLAVAEFPQLVPSGVQLNQGKRVLLAAFPCAGAGQDAPAGQSLVRHPVKSGPFLDQIAVHVDKPGSFIADKQIPVVCPGRIILHRPGGEGAGYGLRRARDAQHGDAGHADFQRRSVHTFSF